MDPTFAPTLQLETLRKRVTDYAQSLTGGYCGSRIEKARYMYEKTVHANFIELSADHRLEPEHFRVLLASVQGVKAVTLHDKSKEEQGNPGAQDPENRAPRKGHYQAQNFMVFSTLYPNDCRGIEFELTESQHFKKSGYPLTISACYKAQGSLQKSLEAWRILRAAVSGKELDSNVVSKFDEELKAFISASIESPTVFSFSSKQLGEPQEGNSVSKYLAASAEISGSRQASPQTATLVVLQRRNAALGCVGSSSPGVSLQPGSASSSAHQQVHRPLSSPASKKTLASSLPQVLDGYRNDEKIRIQVASALEILSASTLTIIRMEEILERPGAIVLEPIFRFAIDQQERDRLTTGNDNSSLRIHVCRRSISSLCWFYQVCHTSAICSPAVLRSCDDRSASASSC